MMHGPHPNLRGDCIYCGEPCYPVPSGYFRHGLLCGSWMPDAEDYCARRQGHNYGHRSPAAMTSDARRPKARAA